MDLKVDAELLNAAGERLLAAAQSLPDAPEPFTASFGSDALSQALSADIPKAEAPIIEGLPPLKTAATGTAESVIEAARRYGQGDAHLKSKIEEAFMAMLLEVHFEKQDLMNAYINEIYLGQDGRRAIHGFGLASQFYFGKPIAEHQAVAFQLAEKATKVEAAHLMMVNAARLKDSGERNDVAAGMAQMSQKFRDAGGEIQVPVTPAE